MGHGDDDDLVRSHSVDDLIGEASDQDAASLLVERSGCADLRVFLDSVHGPNNRIVKVSAEPGLLALVPADRRAQLFAGGPEGAQRSRHRSRSVRSMRCLTSLQDSRTAVPDSRS
jgi:hypothetical protein